jgi:tetratricopeptide (TPR) repeat protein
VTPRPLIFVSAVSRELHSARQLVANTLTFLGYQPVWQEIFGTETGDLRDVLRKKLDQAKGVVQLVGQCYGVEPPAPDEKFGRVSYTQYEALYARQRGKRVWYLFIDELFPADPCGAEPAELRELQAAYRRRVQADSHVFHSLTTTEGLEASVLKLRDDLTRLRRGVKRWAVGITALLVLLVGLVLWEMHAQTQLKRAVAATNSKLDKVIPEYPRLDSETREAIGGDKATDEAKVQEQLDAEISRRYHIDKKIVRVALTEAAEKTQRASNAGALDRANAAYVLKDYSEAERLALQSADEAAKANPPNLKRRIASLELAGLSAQRQIQYARAAQHFKDAERLTDRNRNLEEWATLQHEIAALLFAEGKYNEAERLFRAVVDVRTHALGPEHPDTLDSRHRLIYSLVRQTRNAEAESEARAVLQLREKVLGSEHPDTLASRSSLAHVLAKEGKNAEAETRYREAFGSLETALGPDDPRSVAVREGLADVLIYQGKNEEAEILYRQIIKIDERALGSGNPTTLNDRMNLATALQAEGKLPAAEAEYRDVRKLQEQTLGEEHSDVLTTRNNLAEVLDDEGKYAEAETECRQILPIETKVLGGENELTLNSRGNLVVALIAQGKFGEAEAKYKDVISLMERVLGLEHPDTLGYVSKFAAALARQNRTEEAKEMAKQLAERARQVLGADNSSTQGYVKLAHDLDTPK